MRISKEKKLELLRHMLTNRLTEDRMAILYRQGKVLGGLYLSRGQEAISVGTAYALGDGDVMAPMIRNIGALLVRGITPRDIFLQYLGRADGPTGGRENAHHVGDLQGKGIIAPISQLGKMISVLHGVALSFKIREQPNVAMNYIGDGGASSGDFHEALNMAGVLKSPFILILENNQYAYSTPVQKQSSAKDFYKRAIGYGIHGEQVQGNDVEAVYKVTAEAVERARQGEGPTLIEAVTMRMQGHAQHDDARYVPEDQFAEWRKRDPIFSYQEKLLAAKVITKKALEEMTEEIRTACEADANFALEAALPHGPDAATRVYSPEVR
jgi:TPP-dependent pyruvate/acetoin dehydrogenase alpha subunit